MALSPLADFLAQMSHALPTANIELVTDNAVTDSKKRFRQQASRLPLRENSRWACGTERIDNLACTDLPCSPPRKPQRSRQKMDLQPIAPLSTYVKCETPELSNQVVKQRRLPPIHQGSFRALIAHSVRWIFGYICRCLFITGNNNVP